MQVRKRVGLNPSLPSSDALRDLPFLLAAPQYLAFSTLRGDRLLATTPWSTNPQLNWSESWRDRGGQDGGWICRISILVGSKTAQTFLFSMSKVFSLLPLHRDIFYLLAIFRLSFCDLQSLPTSESHFGNHIQSRCLTSVYQ